MSAASERRKRLAAEFPVAVLRTEHVRLHLKQREPSWLAVSIRVAAAGNARDWVESGLLLNDLNDLGRFIHGLTCRYNAEVRRLNAQAEGVPKLEKLEVL